MVPIHKLAEIFPLMKGQEFQQLVDSVRESGLLEPIVTLDGAILDGRNRYNACLEANVEPKFELFAGDDPEIFVLKRNVLRRHLKPGQRALIMAHFATLKPGDINQQLENAKKNESENDQGRQRSLLTAAQAAEIAQVAPHTIQEAKLVLEKGTEQEINSIRNGESLKPVASAVRLRNKGTHGNRIPGTHDLIELVRKTMQTHENAKEAAKHLKLNNLSYRTIRDLVLLTDQNNLSKKEKNLVKKAGDLVNETRQVRAAKKLISPLVKQIWKKRRIRSKTSKQKREEFGKAVIIALEIGAQSAKLEIPQLSHEQLEQAEQQVSEAIKSLQAFLRNIRKVKKGVSQ